MVWLSAPDLATLPLGTALVVERNGQHSRRLTGRLTAHGDDHVELNTTAMGEILMPLTSIKRARIAAALYEPGDPVLLRHVPAASWRGGVVRTDGSAVLVEQIDGSFAWHDESDLEPADARLAAAPALPRGPVAAQR